MTIAHEALKVKVACIRVRVIGLANAVGPTSIEGSFSSWLSNDAAATGLCVHTRMRVQRTGVDP